jgi:DNA-binding GntR family transcriptional regulator
MNKKKRNNADAARAQAPAPQARERVSLAEDVVGKLRLDIVRGRFKPSEHLRFEQLAERYGVSMSPIREALSRLTAESLVEPDGQRGFRVASISLSDLIGILESQKILEAIALRRSIVSRNDHWEAELIAAHHRLARLEATRTTRPQGEWTEDWEQRHRAFHQALVSGCGLPWLQRFCEVLRDQLDRYRNIAGVPPSRYPAVAMQHEPIVQAAISGAADRAAALLQKHYDAAAKIILTAVNGTALGAVQDLKPHRSAAGNA